MPFEEVFVVLIVRKGTIPTMVFCFYKYQRKAWAKAPSSTGAFQIFWEIVLSIRVKCLVSGEIERHYFERPICKPLRRLPWLRTFLSHTRKEEMAPLLTGSTAGNDSDQVRHHYVQFSCQIVWDMLWNSVEKTSCFCLNFLHNNNFSITCRYNSGNMRLGQLLAICCAAIWSSHLSLKVHAPRCQTRSIDRPVSRVGTHLSAPCTDKCLHSHEGAWFVKLALFAHPSIVALMNEHAYHLFH